MDNLSMVWAAAYVADVIVILLFTVSFVMSTRNIHKEKHTRHLRYEDVRHLPLTYIAWLVYAIVLDVKVVVIFTTFSTDLDEATFFGPNTMKTSLALAALIFLTFLSTQHDVRPGRRREQLVALTSTVLFDILDGVDNMDNLFDKKDREEFPSGLDITIIAICCINFLLPTIPLFTLAKTRFSLRELPESLERFHKLTIAYAVNLPLFITRMITWHGLSSGISIFLLKNIIAISVVTFEICEHFCISGKREEVDENGHEERRKSDYSEENELTEHRKNNRHISDTSV